MHIGDVIYHGRSAATFLGYEQGPDGKFLPFWRGGTPRARLLKDRTVVEVGEGPGAMVVAPYEVSL